MRRTLTSALGAIALAALASGAAHAAPAKVGTDAFKIRSTQDLVDLCSPSDPSDPLYDDAINFCHGFVHGAWQYHQAEANGPEGRRIVCPPDPPPTRSEAIAMFLDWTRTHSQYMSEPAVETMFRFLTEKWPCAEPAAAKKKGAAK